MAVVDQHTETMKRELGAMHHLFKRRVSARADELRRSMARKHPGLHVEGKVTWSQDRSTAFITATADDRGQEVLF